MSQTIRSLILGTFGVGLLAGSLWTLPGLAQQVPTTTVTGTVTANIAAGTNNIGDVDVLSIAAGDNNIGNVDVVTLPALAAGTNNIGDVDILTIAAGDNNIGNVDIASMPADATELPAAAALADNTANPTVPGVAAFLMVWDGSTWDRAQIATDWTVGTAIGTTAPGSQGVYADFDGAAIPTITNVDTEGEAVPFSASIKGVQYTMLVSEDGSLQYGTSTTPLVVDLGANNDVTVTGTVTANLAAGTNNIGDVDLASAIPAGTNTIGGVLPVAATSGGCTPASSISTGAVMETEIKNAAGQLYTMVVTNLDATNVYAKLYNLTAANTDETDTPIQRFLVPTGGGFVLPIPVGMEFDTAITLRVTTGAADNDTGALSANEVFVSYCYQ